MQQVITANQAKQVLKGRAPFEILPYEEACEKLKEATDFIEVQKWDSVADAQAAYAKYHKDDRADLLARQFKLKCFAKYGDIARIKCGEGGGKRRPGNRCGFLPGAQRTLQNEVGMSLTEARAALTISRNPVALVSALESSKPPTPITLAGSARCRNRWSSFYGSSHWGTFCAAVRGCSARDASADAKLSRDLSAVISGARDMRDWLDEFLRLLGE